MCNGHFSAATSRYRVTTCSDDELAHGRLTSDEEKRRGSKGIEQNRQSMSHFTIMFRSTLRSIHVPWLAHHIAMTRVRVQGLGSRFKRYKLQG